jgi:Ion transport protein
MLVWTLISSIGGILNVLVFIMIVWFMFAILGVSLYSKRLIYCSAFPNDPYLIQKNADCLSKEGFWKSYPLNFDNLPNGMLTLLVISSLNNWDQLMYEATDSTGTSSGPIKNTTPEAAYYFILFILICSFFLMNFLIGILFLNFKAVQKQA